MKTKDEVMVRLIDEGYVMTNENWNYICELYDESEKQGLIKDEPIEKKMENFYNSIKLLYVLYGESSNES